MYPQFRVKFISRNISVSSSHSSQSKSDWRIVIPTSCVLSQRNTSRECRLYILDFLGGKTSKTHRGITIDVSNLAESNYKFVIQSRVDFSHCISDENCFCEYSYWNVIASRWNGHHLGLLTTSLSASAIIYVRTKCFMH